jgi:HEAT repeat protein
MSKMKTTFALAAVVALAAFVAPAAPPPTLLLSKRTEAQLIAVLKSDAAQKAKADACRELGVIGTKDCVPVLAGMLADETLNHCARYALEPNPDPSVDAALREALGTLKGRPLVGVIGSIGVRRDLKALEALAQRLTDADPDVAQAAARALGKLGTLQAAKAIQGALAGTAAGNKVAFCEGLLRCAEALLTQGQAEEAGGIYDSLRSLKDPHQVVAGGWRGAILARGKEGLPLLTQALGSDNWIIVAAGARAAIEMKGADPTAVLTAELGKGSTDKQVLVVQVLGKRGDVAAVPALLTTAASGEKAIRLAAIRALPEIGDAAATQPLIKLLADTDREIAQTAQESLAALPGKQVDAAIVAMLEGTDTKLRVTALDLMARRRMTDALPAIVKATTDQDAGVRSSATRRLGELASVKEMPILLDFLVQAKSSQEIDAAEQAVTSIGTKAATPSAMAEQVASALSKAPPAPKSALVRVLGAIGGPAALQAVRTTVNDANPEVHAAAIRALGDWKTVDAAPDLLELAKNGSNATDKTLGLRSYLGLARNTDFPADQRLTMCREASSLVQKADEKKLLLAALGSIQTADSVALIAPYLDDSATKEEASAATVSIAEKLLKGGSAAAAAPKLVEPLKKAAQATSDAELSKRAQALLEQAQKAAAK